MMRFLSGVLLVCLVTLLLIHPAAAGEEKGRAYYDFGVFAFEDGDYEDALGNFQRALELTPGQPDYLHYLGKTQLKLNRLEAAEKSLAAAYEGDAEIPGLVFDMASLHYQKDEYGRAAGLFRQAASNDPHNVLAFYFAGLSYYKLKDYEQAVTYLLKASEVSSNIKTNSYYYAGISQLQLYEFDHAADLLSYVIDNAETEALRANAAKWLAAVSKRKKTHKPLTLAARIGRKHDDNVILEPIGQDIQADEGDWLTMFYAAAKYRFYKRKKIEAGIGYSHYQTLYDNLSEYNLGGSTVQLYGRYAMQPFLFDLSYLPAFYWLDSDSYMLRQRINPRLIWQVDNLSSLSLSYAYMINNHFQDAGRIGHASEVSLDGYRLLPAIDGSISASVVYERDTTRDPDRAFVMRGFRLNLTKNLPWDLALRVGGSMTGKPYSYVDSFYVRKRDDSRYQGSVAISRGFLDNAIDVTGEFSYTKNNSNISDYEYRRNVYALYISARY